MSKLLTGLLAGIAIGILIAPDKGSETRRKLSERINDMKDSVDDFITESKETIESNYQAVKDEATNLVEKGKNTLNNFRGKAENAWNA